MKKVLIIAEAGVNHNGSLETAKKLVDAACESGADIVDGKTWITGYKICADGGIPEGKHAGGLLPGADVKAPALAI